MKRQRFLRGAVMAIAAFFISDGTVSRFRFGVDYRFGSGGFLVGVVFLDHEGLISESICSHVKR
jgi:hypothetical protein